VAEPASDQAGELRRFILERYPVRGFWIRLDAAWRELRRHQHHAPSVEALLGEAVTASVLLAATLKFQGTLTLQLAGDGLVSLLVAQCTHDFAIRAVARSAQAVTGAPAFRELVGAGRLTVTVEADERAARYQGIVALEGQNLAQSIENYFATSEQLPTRIALSADGARAAGVLLQKLPLSRAHSAPLAAITEHDWQQLQTRVALLDPQRLRAGSAEDTLQHICAEHDCRLFALAPVRFVCRCDAARVESVLRSLGAEELRGVLAEQGAVTVTCEFCGRPYRFDAVDVERLLAAALTPAAPRSLN
jgi:molecular chaperone Hsp33